MFRRTLLLCVLGIAGAAAAESKHCTVITTLPYQITTSGNYCLQQGLGYSGSHPDSAIRILANNVTLDCNGHLIEHADVSQPTQYGIQATNYNNIIVRHCQVRGFTVGMWIHGSGNVIEDNDISDSVLGIYATGGGSSIVRRNRVLATRSSAGGYTVGIYAIDEIDVIDNLVDGVRGAAGSGTAAYGISAQGNRNGVICGNLVRNVLGDSGSWTIGIKATDSTRLSILDNRVIAPGSNGTGIYCEDTSSIASDNHVNGFSMSMRHCQDGGNNVELTP